MENTANGVVVPQIEQEQQQLQQKPKKKAKNNKKSQSTTTTRTTTTKGQDKSNNNGSAEPTATAGANQVIGSIKTRDECKSVNGLAHKLEDVGIIANNGIDNEHHMSNGSYVDATHRNLNGHGSIAASTTSNHNVNDSNSTTTTTTTSSTQSNNDNSNSAAARKAKSKSKLKTNNNNNKNLKQTKENMHCQQQQQHHQEIEEQQHTNNGLEINGHAFSKIDIKAEIETLLEEASCSGNSYCKNIDNNNTNSSNSSSKKGAQAVERLANVSTATPTVLTAITAKQKDDTNALIEKNLKTNNNNNNISENKNQSSMSKKEENNKDAATTALSDASVKEIPALDKSKVHIEYTEYQSELQMHDIMRMIQAELSEPYSIYTYRYFIYNWPKLCFLAAHENEYVGAIVCKLDMHMNVKRGYIAMLAVRKEYRNLKIGTTLVQMAIEAMLADNADEVVLETEMRNYPALHLYENLGFVRDKRLFRYYLNGVDALRLKLWFR